jgi:hypothetical protein
MQSETPPFFFGLRQSYVQNYRCFVKSIFIQHAHGSILIMLNKQCFWFQTSIKCTRKWSVYCWIRKWRRISGFCRSIYFWHKNVRVGRLIGNTHFLFGLIRTAQSWLMNYGRWPSSAYDKNSFCWCIVVCNPINHYTR